MPEATATTQEPLADGLPFEVPVATWLAKAEELFGEDPKQWKFRCPCCGNIQTLVDFEQLGVEPQYAYQECIGRHSKQCAKNLGSTPAPDGSTQPCDYAAYGLFRALKGHLVTPESGGKPVPVLPFAVPPTAEGEAHA